MLLYALDCHSSATLSSDSCRVGLFFDCADIHSSSSTVVEALYFSARLRLSKENTDAQVHAGHLQCQSRSAAEHLNTLVERFGHMLGHGKKHTSMHDMLRILCNTCRFDSTWRGS